WFFPKRCLSGSGGGSPRTCLHCSCSSACCIVLSDGLCCLVDGLCVLVKVLPKIALLSLLVEVLPRSALCLFWATVVLPLWFEVCRLVALRSGKVLPGRLLALLVDVLPKDASDELSLLPGGLSVLQSAWALQVKVWCTWPCVWLLRWLACLVARFQVFSAVLVDFVCPQGAGGLPRFLASYVLAQMVVW
ncbi:hypothetical protein Taro_030905, partial [Colocasia esculenta]|nr:hypothetical protein [Colocasia esculenta]